MNSKTRHPDTELFDQLRAGLLDDQAQLKTELETHLRQCEYCRQRTDWQKIAGHMPAPEHLDSRLEAIRKTAMNPAPRAITRFLPVAAAASIVAVLTATLLFTDADTDKDPITIQAQAEPVEIYEDLDFYLWMADHNTENGQHKQTDDHQG